MPPVTSPTETPASRQAAAREDTWRDAEAVLFRLLDELRHGTFPPLDELSPDTARRVGYLAEVAALLLDSQDPGALLKLAASIGESLRTDLGPVETWPLLPFVPGSRDAGAAARMDDLAAAWRLSSGIDISRYLAEPGALPA